MPRREELEADHQREYTADEEGGERGHHIEDADPLVIEGVDPSPEPAEETLEAEKASFLKQPKAVWATAIAAVFAFMGLYLDRRFGWSPWGTVSLTMVGLVGSLYLLIKDYLEANRTASHDAILLTTTVSVPHAGLP